MITTEGKIMLYRMALRKFWKCQRNGLLFEGEREPTPAEHGLDAQTAQIVRNHELNLFNNEQTTI